MIYLLLERDSPFKARRSSEKKKTRWKFTLNDMLTGNTLRLIPTTRIYVDQFIIRKWVRTLPLSRWNLNLVGSGSCYREDEAKKVCCAVFAESPRLKLWAVTRFSEISHVALLVEHTRGKINVEQYVRMAFPDLQVLGSRIFELNLNRGWRVNSVSRMLGVQKLSCHPASITSFAESLMTLNWKQKNSLRKIWTRAQQSEIDVVSE